MDFFRRFLLVAAFMASLIAGPALAEAEYHGFVVNERNGQNGLPVHLSEAQASEHPLAFVKPKYQQEWLARMSAAAHVSLRTEDDLIRFLHSGRLSEVPCNGAEVTSEGMAPSGKGFWITENCKAGETILVLDHEVWLMKISCWNPMPATQAEVKAAPPVASEHKRHKPPVVCQGEGCNPPTPTCEQLGTCEEPTCEDRGDCVPPPDPCTCTEPPPPPPPCTCANDGEETTIDEQADNENPDLIIDDQDDKDDHDNNGGGNGNSGNGGNGGQGGNGNNGVGNGEDPAPPGNPPENDGAGTGPDNPGNQGGNKGGKDK